MNYSVLDRLLDRLIRSERGCWLWTGETSPAGYGKLYAFGRKQYVHRLVYELLVTVIPPGMTVDHLCRVRCCANPDHMEVVSRAENVLRGAGAAAVHARKIVCLRGHPLTGANLRVENVHGRLWRICRECCRMRAAALRRRRKAA